MADYYPLLAKALANLPNRSAPTARRAIYERARKALIGQLRSIQPPMPEVDIAGEDAALDRAIARLETEYGAQSTPASAPTTSPASPPATAPAPKASPVAPPPFPSARPNPPAARPSPAWTPKPAAAPAATQSAAPVVASNPLPRTPIAPRQPTLSVSTPLAPQPARAAPSIEPARPPSAAASSISVAPPVAARHAPSEDESDAAPPIAAAPPGKTNAGIARPSAPGRVEAPRSNPWPLAALILLIAVAGAIALTAYLLRDRPTDVVVKPTSETADKTNPPGQNKIAERIDGAGQAGPTSAVAPGETPIPTVTVPVAPVQVTPGPAASAPTHLADNAQSQPQPQAAPAAVPGSSRAAMLIGVASDPQKPMVNLGSAIWSIIPASPGQVSTLAVRVEIDIPDQKLHATVTIRKNTDASLPATHTIDLRALFADGAEIKGIKDMGLPQLRKEDAATGDAVSGVRVKINDAYYLVGLTRSDTDAAHNLDLLATRNWFDFPLLLNDDRIAKLTFAKGDVGDRVMAQALDAWK
jgi:hypothetical protein